MHTAKPAKAVVFTHVSMTLDRAEKLGDANDRMRFNKRIVPFFKEYLRCSNIGLVYVYVDVGTKIVHQQLLALMQGAHGVSEAKMDIGVSLKELNLEQRARNCLKLAVDQAVRELIRSDPEFDRRNAPRFQFVGLPHLTSLFYNLQHINPVLIKNLAGSMGRFAYDAPKFVEAVIRLVRAAHKIHGSSPILRFDADVEVNEEGIRRLLATVERGALDGIEFDFFSGGYGRSDGVEEPLNDYAVRIAWLLEWEWNENVVSEEREVGNLQLGRWVLSNVARRFLRDLAEIGATQVSGQEKMSTAMQEFVRTKRGGGTSPNRGSPQVISGAGLHMSYAAIRSLPPFMNVGGMTTWIDDHLKRRLHEAVGDLPQEAIERTRARFRQYRHYEGRQQCMVTDEVIRWHKYSYFERLLRGCIAHSLITEPNGEPGLLSREVKHIIRFEPSDYTSDDEFKQQLQKRAKQAAEDILWIWSKVDYGDKEKNLNDWARKMIKKNYVDVMKEYSDDKYPDALPNESGNDYVSRTTATDMVAYVQLVRLWSDYDKAIRALRPSDAYWLFRIVE